MTSSRNKNIKDLFRCPICKEKLHIEGNVLTCSGCAAEWPIHGETPCFIPSGDLPDYGLAANMSELTRTAKEFGWLEALSEHLARSESNRREYISEYVASEARADFRFLMSLGEDATILDIGSGWGNISIAFARSSHRVFSLDTTLANVQFVGIRAQQEGLGNVIPVLGDATRLPFPPASCDGILMVGVLEWVPWGRSDGPPRNLQLKALEEAFYILKPGGQLYVGIENRFGFKNFLGIREPHTGIRFISLLPRVLANIYSEKARKKPFREWTYSKKELEGLLAQAGFKTVDFYYPIPSYQNFRYITDYSTRWISRFLVSRFRGHGRFTEGLSVAGLLASILRIERIFSPCFSVLARKSND